MLQDNTNGREASLPCCAAYQVQNGKQYKYPKPANIQGHSNSYHEAGWQGLPQQKNPQTRSEAIHANKRGKKG